MKELGGKVAFITGGVSGIGLGLATALLERDMSVVVTYRRRSHLESAMSALAFAPRARVHAVELDVTDLNAWQAAAEETARRFGNVHLLCNNAGVNLFGPMDETTPDDWNWILDVNLGGVVNGVVTFLPYLKRANGAHILNVGSMASFIACPTTGAYTASKFAVRGLTECLRYSLYPYRIGVSLLAPGIVATNIGEAPLARPHKYGATSPARSAETGRIAELCKFGMSPLEVGRKAVQGIVQNRMYIFTHPEFREELEDIHREILASLPEEQAPADRAAIEKWRREATAQARTHAERLE